jgi:hypothetical protein
MAMGMVGILGCDAGATGGVPVGDTMTSDVADGADTLTGSDGVDTIGEDTIGEDTFEPDTTPADTTGGNDTASTDTTLPPVCDRSGFGVIEEAIAWGSASEMTFLAATEGSPWDVLSVELLGLGVGTHQLGTSYEACDACVRVLTGCNADTCETEYLATEGRLEVTRLDRNGGRFEGRVVDAKFKRITRNGVVSQWVAGSPTWCIDQVGLSADFEVEDKTYKLLNQSVLSAEVGGPERGSQHSVACASGYAAIGVLGSVWDYDGDNLLVGLIPRCVKLDRSPFGGPSLLGNGTLGVMAAGDLESDSVCPDGQLMVGVRVGLYQGESDASLSGIAARCADIHAWVDTSAPAPVITTEWPIGTVGNEGFECPRGSAIVELRSDVYQQAVGPGLHYVRVHTLQAVCQRLAPQ